MFKLRLMFNELMNTFYFFAGDAPLDKDSGGLPTARFLNLSIDEGCVMLNRGILGVTF